MIMTNKQLKSSLQLRRKDLSSGNLITRSDDIRPSKSSSTMQIHNNNGDYQIELTTVKMNQNVEITTFDARTLILPKVPPCKYCGAHRFYKETDFICCSKGEIVLAESNTSSIFVVADYWN
ncbi:hypothetical protein LIER_15713 [Lithospermum erythrorhizon]|uniref:Uncharacterized protein n=1 Tax=Lithospermum erythrorhizon TaxID=34254 RepID=A0AAV3Q4B5_LITER